MAKGTIAKERVENIIKQAFGENFIGVSDKKIFVWADDGGERVQISIALTCPKVGLETAAAPVVKNGGWDFEAPAVTASAAAQPEEITKEEQENIATLLARLGL